MKKIFLVTHEGFPNYYAICTKIEQYGFDPQRPLFKFFDNIMVKRVVTRKEAEVLLELIKHNGSGTLHGGKAVEVTELN